MSDTEILAWLENDEAGSRCYRVERMSLLLELFGAQGYRWFPGGIVPAQAFDEMRLAYLNGLYVSCVVVSQIVMEHLLAGLFSLHGRDDLQGAGFQKLVAEAAIAGYISQEELHKLNHLRQLRNPYVHSKPIMHPSCFVRRTAETRMPPFDLFKQDAEDAISVIATLLSRDPFFLADEQEGGQG